MVFCNIAFAENFIVPEQKIIEAKYHVLEPEADHIELTEIPDKEREIGVKDLEVAQIKKKYSC